MVSPPYGLACDLPLCANQERSLLLKELARAQGFAPHPNILASAFRITGKLDYCALEQTLSEIVRRHPSLRARFYKNETIPPQERFVRLLKFAKTRVFDSGLYRQSIGDNSNAPIVTMDLIGLDVVARDAKISGIIAEEQRREFEDPHAPLLRGCVIRTHFDIHIFVVFIDHLSGDAWSLSILCSELKLLYSHFTEGAAYPLVPVPCSYPAFAVWENEMAETTYFDASVRYWEEYWKVFGTSHLSARDLPFSTRMSTSEDYLFASEKCLLNGSTCIAIQRFLSANRSTLHVLGFAVLTLLMTIYSGKSKIAIGGHFANRGRPEDQDSIGFYSNTHMIGLDLTTTADGQMLLRQARETIIKCLEHSNIPFPLLWKRISNSYEYPRFLILLDTKVKHTDLIYKTRATTIEQITLPDVGGLRLAGLGFYITQSVDDILIHLQYHKTRFQGDSVRRMLKNFVLLLQDIVSSPNTTLPELTRRFEYQ